MKMGNLKKVASLCKSKTVVLTARLLVLASIRRRTATVGAISHTIHTLMVAADEAVDCGKAIAVPRNGLAAGGKKPAVHHGHVDVDISNQLALFHQDDGVCPNWTLHSIFDDDNSHYNDEFEVDDSDVDDGDHNMFELVCDDDHSEDEPSVMDVIRSNREVEGLEFNVDDEIDQAADMFITRFRNRLSQSL